jgi:phage head maturation protease
MSKSEIEYTEPIPILRSFEKDGQRYLYGYGAIFDSPDVFGTVMTRELVEHSVDVQLRNFPAIRFMHREPFGQIVFDEEIDGQRTFIDNHGFHILVRVYPAAGAKWNMVKNGGWGFSWGVLPEKDGVEQRRLSDGKTYPAFVRGRLYEVSVVDAPAHPDAIAYVMERIAIATPQEEKPYKPPFSLMTHSPTRNNDVGGA